MAIVYSYPKATPELQDLLIGTEMAVQGGEDAPRTRTFTIDSIISLAESSAAAIYATISSVNLKANTDSPTITGTLTTINDVVVNSIKVGRGSGNHITNTMLGFATGLVNASDYNTFLGTDCGGRNTIGSYNTIVGSESGYNNTIGVSNTFLGSYSGFYNVDGDYNTFVGSVSGNTNVSFSNVTCLGYNAQPTASNQVVIGDTNVTTTILRGAVTANKDATFNEVKIGRGGGNINTNTALGTSSLLSNTSGNQNIAAGLDSMRLNTTGIGNSAFGKDSLRNTNGNGNTAIGLAALHSHFIGDGNTAIGASALYNNNTFQNTAVGNNALGSNDVHSNCSGLGYNAQVDGSNQVQLGDAATTPYAYQALNNRSDLRDKTEVRDTVLGLDFINELRPVDYKWDMREDYRTEMPNQGELSDEDFQIVIDEWLESVKLDNITHDGTHTRNRYHHGLIAQEVQDVIEASGVDFGGFQDHKVNGGGDVFSIGYTELIAPMIKAIQELKAEIELLKSI